MGRLYFALIGVSLSLWVHVTVVSFTPSGRVRHLSQSRDWMHCLFLLSRTGRQDFKGLINTAQMASRMGYRRLRLESTEIRPC